MSLRAIVFIYLAMVHFTCNPRISRRCNQTTHLQVHLRGGPVISCPQRPAQREKMMGRQHIPAGRILSTANRDPSHLGGNLCTRVDNLMIFVTSACTAHGGRGGGSSRSAERLPARPTVLSTSNLRPIPPFSYLSDNFFLKIEMTQKTLALQYLRK